MPLSFNHLSLLQAMFLAIFHHIDGVPTFLVSFVITKADLFCFWGIFFFFSNRTFLNCHRMCNGSPLRTFLFQKLRKAIYLIRIRLSKLISFVSVFLTKYIPGGKKSERKNEQKLEGWRMHNPWTSFPQDRVCRQSSWQWRVEMIVTTQFLGS